MAGTAGPPLRGAWPPTLRVWACAARGPGAAHKWIWAACLVLSEAKVSGLGRTRSGTDSLVMPKKGADDARVVFLQSVSQTIESQLKYKKT